MARFLAFPQRQPPLGVLDDKALQEALRAHPSPGFEQAVESRYPEPRLGRELLQTRLGHPVLIEDSDHPGDALVAVPPQPIEPTAPAHPNLAPEFARASPLSNGLPKPRSLSMILG